ncbi:MAG TPA: hypothetical protein PKD58_09940, partial [Candidatus Sumerlaeota bacterium]|nr:hypothetical protein [Candidatus Sumerlaeota bacterium]
ESQFRSLRNIAPEVPFLVPGIGAQGGDLAMTLREGASHSETTNLLLHVTRGVLPARDEQGDIEQVIRSKTMTWNQRIMATLKETRSP